jgi:hypothetical protein
MLTVVACAPSAFEFGSFSRYPPSAPAGGSEPSSDLTLSLLATWTPVERGLRAGWPTGSAAFPDAVHLPLSSRGCSMSNVFSTGGIAPFPAVGPSPRSARASSRVLIPPATRICSVCACSPRR